MALSRSCLPSVPPPPQQTGAFFLETKERPETPSLFGREEILERIEQRLEALKKGYRQNLGLVGPCFIGKTSLARTILERHAHDPEILPLYVSLSESDFDGFVERWVGGILQSMLTWKGDPVPEEFQLLVKTSRDYIPKTMERMREAKKHAFQKKTALAFRELLALTDTLREETGKKILLVLDEFQALSSLELTNPFALFGREMMIQKDTLYLVTSSAPHRAREIFSNQLSLLFGNFELIHVGLLSFEDVRSWIEEKFADLGIPEEDLRLLGHLLDNRPYYFEIVLEAVRLRSRGETTAWSRDRLIGILTELLFSERGAFHRHYESELRLLFRLARYPHAYLRCLSAVASGRFKLAQITAYIGKKMAETKKLLQRLIMEGVLEKRGSFFWVQDPLFRFWLRSVSPLREREFSPWPGASRPLFESRLRGEIRKIEEEDRADLTHRMESLFREFRNDVVEVSQRKIKCPAFFEITSRPTNGRYFPLLSRTSQGRWFCQVYREPVTESDVTGFSEELSRFRSRMQRKIMVALGGIELNAKLLAQESKIEVWDLENVNALLDLYGKQKLMAR